MATNLPTTENDMKKTIEQLKKEVTCNICQNYYTDPKVLPCCHYYCKECINDSSSGSGVEKIFSCPDCSKDVIIPKNLDHLQTAVFIPRMIEVHTKLEKAHSKVQAKCEMCSGSKLKAFCKECGQFICTECSKRHQKMKISADHKIISLAEFKEGGARDVIKMESSHQDCKDHKEPMKIYCFDCNCLICRDCTVIDHVGHNFEFCNKSAQDAKKKILQSLHPLRDSKVHLSRAMDEIKTTKSAIKHQDDILAQFVEDAFGELVAIVLKRKQELLVSARERCTCKLENLSEQKKSLSVFLSSARSVIRFVERYVWHSTDDEIMYLQHDVLKRIAREVEEHLMEENNLEPVEEVDIGVAVSLDEDFKHLCQIKAVLTTLPVDPSRCEVTGDGTMKAEVNKPSDFLLLTKLYNSSPSRQMCAVDCQLKSLGNGSIIKCEIYRIKSSEYRIQYTPVIPGEHELVVTVNGVNVSGSPFPVSVTTAREPTQLGYPTQVIEGFNLPYGVTVNSSGEIIITEIKGGIVVFDRKGNKIKSMDLSDHNISKPTGVAVDESGGLYIADHEKCRIVKLGRELDVITTNITKPDSKLFGVAVVGEEVMVCDSKNDCIMVYTKELEYVRQIASYGGDDDSGGDGGGARLSTSSGGGGDPRLSIGGGGDPRLSIGGGGDPRLSISGGVGGGARLSTGDDSGGVRHSISGGARLSTGGGDGGGGGGGARHSIFGASGGGARLSTSGGGGVRHSIFGDAGAYNITIDDSDGGTGVNTSSDGGGGGARHSIFSDGGGGGGARHSIFGDGGGGGGGGARHSIFGDGGGGGSRLSTGGGGGVRFSISGGDGGNARLSISGGGDGGARGSISGGGGDGGARGSISGGGDGSRRSSSVGTRRTSSGGTRRSSSSGGSRSGRRESSRHSRRSRIQDLSADSHGNLYVSDSGKSCIQVLSNDGTYLYSIGYNENGVNKLKDPSGICVAGKYVYVADYHNRDVSVFTTEGDYVTSFGKEGNEKGNFNRPRGVYVDKDNSVYVCDCGNNRVQVF